MEAEGASSVWSTVWSLSGQHHSSSSELWSRATAPPFATPTGRVPFKGQTGSAYTLAVPAILLVLVLPAWESEVLHLRCPFQAPPLSF